MVLHKHGDKLYSGLVTTMTTHLKEIARAIAGAQGSSFLVELNRKWVEHNKSLQMIRDILMYMERTYVTNANKTPVHELGLSLWRDNIVRAVKIKDRLLDTLLRLVCSERTGDVINRGLMRDIIKMLTEVDPSVYQDDFEKPFLDEASSFYSIESRRFIECCDCGDYLKKAERRLNEVIERVSHCLDAKSEGKIINVVEREMIANHMQRLVHMENSGLVSMLVDDKYDDLGRMYNMFRRVSNGLATIQDVMTSRLCETGRHLVTDSEKLKDTVHFVQCLLAEKDKYTKIISMSFNNDKTFLNALNLTIQDVMNSHLCETGRHLVTDSEKVKDPVDFVQCLLDEKNKYTEIISMSCNNDKTFLNALNSSFEYFINLNPRSPGYISLFVDDKLRKGLRGVNEDDAEAVLDKVMMLFRHLQEKDVFEKYYKQHLAKRLLSGKTVSDDAERSIIVKLKTECGYRFTSKLEGMFTDMKTSQDTMQGFNSMLVASGKANEEPTLSVQILTTGSWPTQTGARCNLPGETMAVCDLFKDYYLRAHIGRRLTWQTNMGTADLKGTFANGKKHELNVSTYQMCVLMLFNSAERLSYKDIEQATNISASDLKRCFQSLACVKGRNVLVKEPMSKEISEEDAFYVNENFTCKFYKVKIGTVTAQKESEPEKQETRQRVEEDRIHQIDAAIVRIMKSRRVLDLNNVVAEVTRQLQSRFLPNPAVIKKRLESLIERDFLERDKTDRKLLKYLA